MTINQPEATVGDLGEQGILDTILPLLDSQKANLGPGDDAGALSVQGSEILVSVDTLVENQDFKLVWPSGLEHRAYDIGWKSIAQNVSDINAMGGTTTGAVVSLSLPVQTSLQWVKDFARGMADAINSLEAKELAILGGDLGKSTEISVTTTVLGECAHGKILRNGAKPGDVIAVAGRLGDAGAGLSVLEHGSDAKEWSRAVRRIVEAQCKPAPPLGSGPRAAEAGAHAMMDISDGLVRDSTRLAKSSGISIDYNGQILQKFASRLAPAAQLTGTDPMAWVLHGGEDFGLVAAFPTEADVPEEFTVIGVAKARSGRRSLVTVDGKPATASAGFDHFN
ncbi:thiamine-phosphate kinase [Glutamicibacter sp. JL.03c]|uniref:thiamine-phosphate kinase n=1 Tax=Glutamicibacter sp. JL.03c TaxID=2984842 RepID=UPI0021F7BC07|nr:thiamine-phosphate kinase [Glutamicibacter sp. JL.03c]UYQ78839.1 thiamine-phosphate kinase [Glutamicibacter sp. JL.03c]